MLWIKFKMLYKWIQFTEMFRKAAKFLFSGKGSEVKDSCWEISRAKLIQFSVHHQLLRQLSSASNAAFFLPQNSRETTIKCNIIMLNFDCSSLSFALSLHANRLKLLQIRFSPSLLHWIFGNFSVQNRDLFIFRVLSCRRIVHRG